MHVSDAGLRVTALSSMLSKPVGIEARMCHGLKESPYDIMGNLLCSAKISKKANLSVCSRRY